MDQKGWKLGGSVTIDSMLYTYISNSNKLLNVLDRKNDTATRLGDFRSSKAYMTALSNNKTTSAVDYTYDANGNLSLDNNKDITLILYNHLNLPDSIRIKSKGSIKYIYDAAGNKLKKTTVDSTGASVKTTTTLYLFGNYVNDTLQYIPTEEGRVRAKDSTVLVYDYFIKDHLGNVRVLLTEQKDTNYYVPASLETTPLNTEKLFYAGLDTGRVNKNTVTDYPTDAYTDPNDYVQKLNGDEAKVGASIVLKVMAGDKFNLRVSSWWKSTNSPNAPVSPLNDLLSAISGGVGSLGGIHESATEITNSGVLSPNITNFFNSYTGNYNTNKPKAFINWILFDEHFNYVSNSSGFEQVGASNTFTTHTPSTPTLSKNGYLYIYVSNETPNIDVIFDNLQVTHIRGPLVEETHYYPFGLTMSGISSKALSFGDPKNKEKTFQEQRFDDDLGLNWVQFKWRNHDPQIGRFIEMDPLSDKYVYNSTYAFSENKVIAHIELEGLETAPLKKPETDPEKIQEEQRQMAAAAAHYYQQNKQPVFSFTATITAPDKGGFSLGVAGKVTPWLKVSAASFTNEKDVLGVRDNNMVVGGTESASKDDVRRTGDAFGVGVGPVALSFSDVTETRSFNNTKLSEKNTFSTQTGLDPVTVVTEKTTDKKTTKTETKQSAELFGLKLAVGYGFEASLKFNGFGGGTPYGSMPGNHADATFYRKPINPNMPVNPCLPVKKP